MPPSRDRYRFSFSQGGDEARPFLSARGAIRWHFGPVRPIWYILAKAKKKKIQNREISVWSSPGMILIQRWARSRITKGAIVPVEVVFGQVSNFGSSLIGCQVCYWEVASWDRQTRFSDHTNRRHQYRMRATDQWLSPQ